MSSRDERPGDLPLAAAQARECVRCPQLAATRTQVVFGSGPADAELLILAEAPGREEDERGLPLVGRARGLLDALLAEVGIDPGRAYLTTALLCRPPENRDPTPSELERCRDHLIAQVELVRPKVVCTLGSVATRVVRGTADPIVRVRGRTEVVELGGHQTRLLPVLHPVAALYRDTLRETLRRDLAQLPGLLALPQVRPQPQVGRPPVAPGPLPPPDAPTGGQLGLF